MFLPSICLETWSDGASHASAVCTVPYHSVTGSLNEPRQWDHLFCAIHKNNQYLVFLFRCGYIFMEYFFDQVYFLSFFFFLFVFISLCSNKEFIQFISSIRTWSLPPIIRLISFHFKHDQEHAGLLCYLCISCFILIVFSPWVFSPIPYCAFSFPPFCLLLLLAVSYCDSCLSFFFFFYLRSASFDECFLNA